MQRSVCSRSAIRCCTSSMPVEYLTRHSGMPAAARFSAVHSTWLVRTGGPTTVWTHPRFAAICAYLSCGRNSLMASRPPLTLKLSMPPNPRICLRAILRPAGVLTHLVIATSDQNHSGSRLEVVGQSDSVSLPWRKCAEVSAVQLRSIGFEIAVPIVEHIVYIAYNTPLLTTQTQA